MQTFYEIKVQEEGMRSSESEQHSQRRSSMGQNFRPHVEAREAEDGRRLLGIYTSEAEEEICNVGFAKGWRKTS